MGNTFRIASPKVNYDFTLNYNDNFLLIGSCFSENIGQKMSQSKFNIGINPFGILYNPISIAHNLSWLLSKEFFTEQHLVQHQGFWHSFFHHSQFSSTSVIETRNKINKSLKQARTQLANSQYLFLTLGTAKVFRYRTTNQIVANCHKIPIIILSLND